MKGHTKVSPKLRRILPCPVPVRAAAANASIELHGHRYAANLCSSSDSLKQNAACRKVVVSAYKDIDAVMAAQSDLVEIVHTLKQIVCVKG